MAKSKNISESYIERAALHYLGRFSSTEANLRAVLERKVRRRLEEGQALTDEHKAWIAAAAQKCVKYGYVDDKLYAKNRYESLLRKGKPLRVISQDLNYKGVPQHIIQEILAAVQDEPEANVDLSAAAAYAKRRRFGPFRRADRTSEDKIEKEKAAMMRAGFPYQMVRRILDSSEDEIIQLLP